MQSERGVRGISVRACNKGMQCTAPNLYVNLATLSCSFKGCSVRPSPGPCGLFCFHNGQGLGVDISCLLGGGLVGFCNRATLDQGKTITSLGTLRLAPTSCFSLLLLCHCCSGHCRTFFKGTFSRGSTIQGRRKVCVKVR